MGYLIIKVMKFGPKGGHINEVLLYYDTTVYI